MSVAYLIHLCLSNDHVIIRLSNHCITLQLHKQKMRTSVLSVSGAAFLSELTFVIGGNALSVVCYWLRVLLCCNVVAVSVGQ